jgi:hypothetical protein
MQTHSRLLRSTIAALVVTSAASVAGCPARRDPIGVKDGMLVLENQSTREWRTVRITINDHFSAGAPSLPPRGLLTAPLRDFQTGFGQRFDRGRMRVFKVRVSAIDADGQAVTLSWGK